MDPVQSCVYKADVEEVMPLIELGLHYEPYALWGVPDYVPVEAVAEVVDKGIEDPRTPPENRDSAFGRFAFVDLKTDENSNNAAWTKSQTYLVLGNTLHVLARLGIDSTPMEGVDRELISANFAFAIIDHFINSFGIISLLNILFIINVVFHVRCIPQNYDQL